MKGGVTMKVFNDAPLPWAKPIVKKPDAKPQPKIKKK